jgi:hypothetical protein
MQHAVLRLREQHWREWEYEPMKMLAVLCRHAVRRWLITNHGNTRETYTKEAAEYTNTLPLILREHECINFFSCFKITICANTKFIDKFINKLFEDKHKSICCMNLELAFWFDSARFNITYVDPHRTFMSSNSCTGCLTPFRTWMDLKSSLRWEEDRS